MLAKAKQIVKPLSASAFRRQIIAAAILFAPIAATAQQAPKTPVVGILSVIPSASTQAAQGQEAFEKGLREIGLIPGKNLRIEYRNPEGKLEQLDALARDLVRLRVEVIVARGPLAIEAAKKATTTIPIVMSATGADPVQQGFVASLARPGGNITGLTLLTSDLLAKQLQLLKEVVPRASRVAVLGHQPLLPKAQQDVEAAAATLGLKLEFVKVASVDQLEGAFKEMRRTQIDGLLVRADPIVLEANRERVAALARKYRFPAIFWLRAYAEAGGLIAYGADLLSVHRRSASYVDRIIRGAKPADLPVEEPSRFTLVVNLETARELGLRFPPSILARADEILQRAGSF